jgi:23S rRNA pseudouridine2605 synthase
MLRNNIKLLKINGDSPTATVYSEGLNKDVRIMFARVGLLVKSLKRVAIGKITTHGLGVGSFRLLTHSEVNYLKKATAAIPPAVKASD